MENKVDQTSTSYEAVDREVSSSSEDGDVINTSGHRQELDRNFRVWSICALSIATDNAWAAGAGSLVVSLYDGGGPGVLYGLIGASFFYIFVVASLAELASAIPSSAGVYHWTSVTSGRYGRICSFFAGWWNLLAWTFGTAGSCLFGANAVLAMYTLYHPDFTPQRWQIFIAMLGVCWLDCLVVLFGQRIISTIGTACGSACLLICLVSTLVCAIMPSHNGHGHASSRSVWTDWQNETGWSSNGFVYLAGMLNGVFAIGTPDAAAHVSEEIPNPRRNVPIGMAAQLTGGFVSTFCFYIAILYAVTDIAEVQKTNIVSLPLAAMFQQATRSQAGTFGLLFLFLLDVVVTIPGSYITCSRMLWTLARDDATPFSHTLRRVSPRWRNPFAAQVAICCFITVLGCIYIGSATAFNACIGVFAVFMTLSYLAAILPHMFSGRSILSAHRGVFWMPAKVAYPVMAIACFSMVFLDIIFMFPYSLPVSASTMNYDSLMAGGCTILLVLLYLWKRKHGYTGPHVALEARDDLMKGIVEVHK